MSSDIQEKLILFPFRIIFALFFVFDRAVARLQNETVFGSIINVKLKTKPNKTIKDDNHSKPLPVQPLPNNSNFINAIPTQMLSQMQNPLFNGNGFLPPPPQSFQMMPFPQSLFPVTTSTFSMMNPVINGMQPGIFTSKQSTITSISSSPSANFSSTAQKKNQSNDQKEIEVFVNKLDDTVISNKEFKRGIFNLLDNKYKVSSFTIMQTDKENMSASMKLPKLIDALWCIHNMNKACMATNHLKFSLEEKISLDPLTKLKTEVFALLYNHKEKWMSINDFLNNYKSVYKRAFHVLDLDKVKELVHIDGKPQFQFVSLLQNPIGSARIKLSPNVKEEFVSILRIHNRRVPLSRYLCFQNLN